MTIYAYLRVSTILQDEQNQRLGVDNYAKQHNIKIDKYIVDKVSGITDPKLRNLGKLLKKAKKEDTIIVSEISRLSRKLFDLIEIINCLLKNDIAMHAVKENFDLGNNIQSQVVVFAFGLAASIERDLLSSRTREALALCKLRGKKLGRPVGSVTKNHKLDPDRARMCHDFIRGYTYTYLANRYRVSRKTVVKYINKHLSDPDIQDFKEHYKPKESTN